MEVSPARRNGDAWARITSWDGEPRTYGDLEALVKCFEVDVAGGWRAWQVNYNVAARFVVGQTGAARARAELFEPEGLAGDDPVMEDGEVIRPATPPLASRGSDGCQRARRPDGGRAEG